MTKENTRTLGIRIWIKTRNHQQQKLCLLEAYFILRRLGKENLLILSFRPLVW